MDGPGFNLSEGRPSQTIHMANGWAEWTSWSEARGRDDRPDDRRDDRRNERGEDRRTRSRSPRSSRWTDAAYRAQQYSRFAFRDVCRQQFANHETRLDQICHECSSRLLSLEQNADEMNRRLEAHHSLLQHVQARIAGMEGNLGGMFLRVTKAVEQMENLKQRLETEIQERMEQRQNLITQNHTVAAMVRELRRQVRQHEQILLTSDRPQPK